MFEALFGNNGLDLAFKFLKAFAKLVVGDWGGMEVLPRDWLRWLRVSLHPINECGLIDVCFAVTVHRMQELYHTVVAHVNPLEIGSMALWRMNQCNDMRLKVLKCSTSP